MLNAVALGYDALIDELSRVFSEPGEARELAQRAGFPVADVPVWVTASIFWGHLVRAALDGKLLGGVGAIVAQARARFPHNPVFAAQGSKTVVAPVQPGLRLVHGADPPLVAPSPAAHGIVHHRPPGEMPAGTSAPRNDATTMNAQQSPFAPHPAHAYPPPASQPIGTVGHAGRGARGSIKIDASTKTDNRKGLGAAGVTSILLVVGAALCTMGWFAFEAIKNMPRNVDGSVTVWGFTLPAVVVGEAPAEEREPPTEEREPPTEEREEEPTSVSSPTPPPVVAPTGITPEKLEGVWNCHPGSITFTETGRAAFSSAWRYEGTPFGKWTDQPYTIVSARTIEVAGVPAQVEVSDDGHTLRAVGGNRVLKCRKVPL